MFLRTKRVLGVTSTRCPAGGVNQFAVWANSEKNSVMGSEVEGALINDPLVAFALQRKWRSAGTRTSLRRQFSKMTDAPSR